MPDISSIDLHIESRILLLRGRRVIIDSDLAALYGVPTFRLNEQVKRNQERFPDEFMFTLDFREKSEVIAKCDHLKNLRFSPVLPTVFTEYGALMAASILKSARAIQVSIEVIKAFVRMREMLASHRELAEKLAAMEEKYDIQFLEVFEAIELLAEVREEKRNRKLDFVKDDLDETDKANE
jgi:ORF6N domain